MQIIIYIALGLVVGYLIGRLARSRLKSASTGSVIKESSGLVNQKRIDEKNSNLKEILDYLQTHDQIKNDDVEKMLNVSNATAERYLNELEEQGRLTQVGKIGQGVFYKKK
jgi:Fic family protein